MGGAVSDETAGLSTAEFAERAGISVRQAFYWAERDWLHPEGNGGTGNPWSWPEAEIEIARRMGRLTAAGLPLEWCAQFARNSWPQGELAAGIKVVVCEDGAATPRLSLSDYGRLYLREGHRAHLSLPFGTASISEALCPVMPTWPDEWLGTGSQAEYEKAAALPVCCACMARYAVSLLQWSAS